MEHAKWERMAALGGGSNAFGAMMTLGIFGALHFVGSRSLIVRVFAILVAFFFFLMVLLSGSSHNLGGAVLFFAKGFFLQTLDDEGNVKRAYDMPGPGWAALGTSIEANTAFIGNFFTGSFMKFDLESGNAICSADTGVERSLAGIAQYGG